MSLLAATVVTAVFVGFWFGLLFADYLARRELRKWDGRL